jgi:hypothetical protein
VLHIVVETVDEAERWALERLREAGLPAPPPRAPPSNLTSTSAG